MSKNWHLFWNRSNQRLKGIKTTLIEKRTVTYRNRKIRIDRIVFITIYVPGLVWLVYHHAFVPRPELPWWDRDEYALPSDEGNFLRVAGAAETANGPVVFFNELMPTPVSLDEAKAFLGADIQILESRRDKLVEEIQRTRKELLDLQQFKLEQIEIINQILERNASKERFLGFLLGIVGALLVEALMLSQRIRKYFIEEK